MVFSERGDNATTSVTEKALQKCGANNCPADDIGNNTNLKKPEMKQVIARLIQTFSIRKVFLDVITLESIKEALLKTKKNDSKFKSDVEY